MTENQEKELFTTLATLVTGVRGIQIDVTELKTDVSELKTDVQVLKTDVKEIRQILNEHSESLNRLEAKTDTIAITVLANEKRLDNVEKEIDELRSEVH